MNSSNLSVKSRIPANLYFPSLVIFITLILIGVYPGIGGEGNQRNTNLIQEKTDFGGFLVPLLYGYWPDSPINWLYSLTIFQVAVYLIGMKLIYNQLKYTVIKQLFLFITIIGFFFLLQIVRDSTALAFYVIGLGLIISFKKQKRSIKIILYSFGIFFIVLGCLMKPAMSPIVSVILLIFTWNDRFKFKNKFFKVSALLVFAFGPYLFDKFLTSELDFKPEYPEQQLFLYDLAKMSCWGNDVENIQTARNALKPFLSERSDFQILCSELNPMYWDDLHRRIPGVQGSPAIELYRGLDSSIVKELFSNWAGIIIKDPFTWAQNKVTDSSQVLVMANSIYLEPLLNSKSEYQIISIGKFTLNLIYTPIKIMDKLRLFSLGFALIVGFTLIFINGRLLSYNRDLDLIVLKFILVNLFIWLSLTLLYIANPGRYVFPYVFLSYVYLIREIDLKYNKFTPFFIRKIP